MRQSESEKIFWLEIFLLELIKKFNGKDSHIHYTKPT